MIKTLEAIGISVVYRFVNSLSLQKYFCRIFSRKTKNSRKTHNIKHNLIQPENFVTEMLVIHLFFNCIAYTTSSLARSLHARNTCP